MTLPKPLQAGIDDIVGNVDTRQLERSARALSDAYRAGGAAAARAARTADEVAAYLATRAPATHAATADVLGRLGVARPGWSPASLVDLGAGPGIASWAALETWPEITSVTLVEAEQEMVKAGRKLAIRGGAVLQEAEWVDGDVAAGGVTADLVIAAYLVGELEPATRAAFTLTAWARTRDTLVIVEPGTTAGYERVLASREAVIDAGGWTLAPCPHDASCPLPSGDWCHFATRLARTGAHRRAKGAERGFEDEKFSYAVLCRSPHERAEARVIRRPDPRPGHVVLDVCAASGLDKRTVSRRDGAAYRRARKLGWGDAL